MTVSVSIIGYGVVFVVSARIRAVKRRASLLFWKKPFVYLYAVFLTGITVFAFYGFLGLAETALMAFAETELGDLPFLTAFVFASVPAVLGLIRFFALDVSVGGVSVFEILYYFSSGKNFAAASGFCLCALLYVSAGGLLPATLFAIALQMEGALSPFLEPSLLELLCVVTEVLAFASLAAVAVRVAAAVNASFVFVRFERVGAEFAFRQAERFSEGSVALAASFWLPLLVSVALNSFLLLLFVPYFLLSLLVGFECRRDADFLALQS